ncbi:MAG: folate family ECF transporter S component [Oscillospiraceae bacterium]|nr:folate family ECF transporter S component [Oscillospiraceae bacterium]
MKNFWKDQFHFSINEIAATGFLVALEVVLNRFASINLWNLKIGLAFIPIMVAGMLLGPVKAGVVGVVSDLIGAILFPSGAFFPGFTLSAFIRGFLYGACLYKNQKIINLIIASFINQFGISLFITSFWLHILYASPYWPLVYSRLVQVIPLFFVELVVGITIANTLVSKIKPYIKSRLV